MTSLEEVNKSLLAPQKVPQGQRKRPTKKGAHKAKVKPGKGQYVKAPLLRDKVANPRWTANALINNPGSAAATTAVGAAGALQLAKPHMSQKHQDEATAAQGGLVGGAAGKSANDAGWYAGKKAARKGISQVSHKGEYGPYKEGPHQADLKALSRKAQKQSGNNPRKKAAYFHEHYPANAPGATARKVMTALDRKPTKAGFIAGGAALGAGAAYGNRKINKRRVMSDTEIKRRKKVQGHIGRTTSTLGLTSVGLLGASVAAKKPGGATYGALKKIPGLTKIGSPAQMGEKLKGASFGTSITAGGIGGVGGFNQAAIYDSEGRKRKEPMVKRDEMAPMYGEIAKAWTPVHRKFDAEANRHRRNKIADVTAATVGGTTAAAGALTAADGAITRSRKTVKTGGKIMAAGAGGLAVSHVISRKRDGDWQSYSKSAFGITHD